MSPTAPSSTPPVATATGNPMQSSPYAAISQRAERCARLVGEELSILIGEELKDPRVAEAGLVSVTHVQVSADLGMARVFVWLLDGSPVQQKRLLEGLESARPFLRRELGLRLQAKKVPDLSFRLDDGEERAARVEQLLAEINRESKP